MNKNVCGLFGRRCCAIITFILNLYRAAVHIYL